MVQTTQIKIIQDLVKENELDVMNKQHIKERKHCKKT